MHKHNLNTIELAHVCSPGTDINNHQFERFFTHIYPGNILEIKLDYGPMVCLKVCFKNRAKLR